MAMRDVIGAGVLVATMAAGVALSQNQVQISGSGQNLPAVQQGMQSDATGLGLTAAAGARRAGFVENTPLTLNRLSAGAYSTSVLLLNAHCAAEDVSLTLQLVDRNDEPFSVPLALDRIAADGTVTTGTRWTMAPGTYERVRFRLGAAADDAVVTPGLVRTIWTALRSAPMDYGGWTGHLPARGLLILTLHSPPPDKAARESCTPGGPAPATTTRAIALQPPLPSATDTGVLLGALLLALVTTLVAAVIIFRSTDLFLVARMGTVTFDFKNSWGANVAIGAGILAALSSGAILSQDQYSSNSTTYLLMASLFAALVPLGSALYGLIRPPAQPGASPTEPQGYVSVYLLSSGIVLWGALGQLLLLGMILRELALARVLSAEPAAVLIWMTKGLIVVLIGYAILNALTTVRSTSAKGTPDTPPGPRPAAAML
jgi:hypothetical protein